MRIRSVTIFAGPDIWRLEAELPRAGALAAEARRRLIALGYEVQTTRLALPPLHDWAAGRPLGEITAKARKLDAEAAGLGIDYVSLGPLNPQHDGGLMGTLPQLFAETQRLFTSAFITSGHSVLSGALPQIARAVLEIARSTENGFGNLRFAALASCGPHIPFFPAAYASGRGDFSFALALEAADLALDACRNATSCTHAMLTLRSAIESHSQKIEPVLQALAKETAANFCGFDWSLAPHPDPARSIVAAIEALSGAPLGGNGSLSAVAMLTSAIRSADVRHTGFSGVFLPVLEDALLAQRADEKSCDLSRLLLYSSVCGAGLDTIPLPGDVSAEAIAALLADVASLSIILHKPLTARLMPVPGLKPGQRTAFDFPYLVNAQPLELAGRAPGLLRDASIELRPREP
ncbi:MAG TPA: DUF711 family protein [Planctomycetota bacterium]|jgi:hypothetical protein